MAAYYSELVRISIFATLAIIVYLLENELISRKRINALIAIGILIIICVSLESSGFLFNDKKDFLMLHGIIKSLEFSLAPIIPILFSWVLAPNGFSFKKQIIIILGLLTNATFEFLSVIVPFTFYINSTNIYIRGSYYWIYVLTYSIGIVYLLFELVMFAIRFQSKNTGTLVYLLLFVFYGFSIRLTKYELYTDWLIVTIAYIIFVLVYTDITLKMDALTLLLNRKAFENRKETINYPTVVFMLDLNDFKTINDSFGHDAGDNALKIMASLIKHVFSDVAFCFRIGGDEFCLILKPNKLKQLEDSVPNHNIFLAISTLINKLNDLIEIENEKHDLLKNGISIGYGISAPNKPEDFDSPYYATTLQDALKIADNMMYEAKRAHSNSTKNNKTD